MCNTFKKERYILSDAPLFLIIREIGLLNQYSAYIQCALRVRDMNTVESCLVESIDSDRCCCRYSLFFNEVTYHVVNVHLNCSGEVTESRYIFARTDDVRQDSYTTRIDIVNALCLFHGEGMDHDGVTVNTLNKNGIYIYAFLCTYCIIDRCLANDIRIISVLIGERQIGCHYR